jgi:hypothetical protein
MAMRFSSLYPGWLWPPEHTTENRGVAGSIPALAIAFSWPSGLFGSTWGDTTRCIVML